MRVGISTIHDREDFIEKKGRPFHYYHEDMFRVISDATDIPSDENMYTFPSTYKIVYMKDGAPASDIYIDQVMKEVSVFYSTMVARVFSHLDNLMTKV